MRLPIRVARGTVPDVDVEGRKKGKGEALQGPPLISLYPRKQENKKKNIKNKTKEKTLFFLSIRGAPVPCIIQGLRVFGMCPVPAFFRSNLNEQKLFVSMILSLLCVSNQNSFLLSPTLLLKKRCVDNSKHV